MSKFHRIEGKFPAGTTVYIEHISLPGSHPSLPKRLPGLFGQMDAFADLLAYSATQHTSSTPITLRVDVPEESTAETAKVLRAMADELVK